MRPARTAGREAARDVAVLYEDGDIVVVDKPAGQYVHPSPGHEDGTLAEALAATRPGMRRVGSPERPGVVHRLDADTSGVMVFAKTPRAYAALRAQFEAHDRVGKTYLAVLHGAPDGGAGVVDAPIGRMPWDARRMAVVPEAEGGRRAVTRWETLGRRGGLALVRFDLETGRTHQIRVHAAHLGHPLAGDPLYGDAARDRALRRRPARTLLHAAELSFDHPATGRRMTFSAPPPSDLVHCCG